MEIGITEIFDTLQKVRDNHTTSLPQFIRPAIIESPCFMQASLAEEPVVNDIIKNLYNVYIGYILIALQMNDLVVGNRRVRDVIGTVSTSGATESFIDSNSLIIGLGGAVEAGPQDQYAHDRNAREERRDQRDVYYTERRDQRDEGKNQRDIRKEQRDTYKDIHENEKYRQDHIRDEHEVGAMTRASGNSGVSAGPLNVDRKSNIAIASGRQVEVSMSTGPGMPPVNVVLNVKFNTRLIPESVVEYILAHEFDRSISERWLQFRSGEIRFVKDFVFGMDKLKRRSDALRHDKDHALQDVFRQKSKSELKHMAKIAGNTGAVNLANSILMLDEMSATRYAKRSGFDINNVRDRRRFFNSTYNLFIVLVDSRYSRVTIYTNGIDQSASYSFNELKASAASDKMSLKEVMDYLSKGQNPKF